MCHDLVVPRICRVFLMLAVAGLWIERRKKLRPARFSFLRLYQQALNGFARLISGSRGEELAGTVKQLGALNSLRPQRSRLCRTYDRRELRMRW
jgi:hypothetical protein